MVTCKKNLLLDLFTVCCLYDTHTRANLYGLPMELMTQEINVEDLLNLMGWTDLTDFDDEDFLNLMGLTDLPDAFLLDMMYEYVEQYKPDMMCEVV